MAHLTCVGHTADQIGQILDDLWKAGICNVLALRGDPPAGQSQFVATEGGFSNADALVAFARGRHDFCIGVAGYPEGHPQCLNKSRDMEHLSARWTTAATFIVTQLFFDNADFYRFRDAARAAGIRVPIIAGIMPILNVAQIKRFISMCGAKIPQPSAAQAGEPSRAIRKPSIPPALTTPPANARTSQQRSGRHPLLHAEQEQGDRADLSSR